MTLTANPKLSDWTEYWLETYVRPVAKPSGYEHYHDNMYKHILPSLGTLCLSELSTAVIQKFLNEVAEHGKQLLHIAQLFMIHVGIFHC